MKLGSENYQITGPRHEVSIFSDDYPEALRRVKPAPETLYCIGDPAAMQEGLAIVGARKATPYGLGAAKRFGDLAAKNGIVVISGGARGCDCASQRAALDAGGKTVAFLASPDVIYPKQNFRLFQEIVNRGGCLVSEQPWGFPCLAHNFRRRNRLIAGLAKATLIVEAGIPSGTFSTADDALSANREVLVVPGAITSKESAGCNRLIYQGAVPIINDEVFIDQLNSIFGTLKQRTFINASTMPASSADELLLSALNASKLRLDDLLPLAREVCGEANALSWLMLWIARARSNGWIALYPDGSYGPKI